MRRRLPQLSDMSFGIVAVILSLTVIFAVESGAVGRLFAAATSRTITAVFADARQLNPGDPVRISGVDVGQVSSVKLNPGGRSATVSMRLQGKPGPLYANASAQIRFRTLLGGAFYVKLDRGTSTSGQLGFKAIAERHTDSQVEVDDITSVVAGQAKQGLQTLPGQMAEALADPQYPARTLSTLAGGSATLAGGLGAARGEQPATDIPTLISSADTALRALDAPDGELRQMVSGAAATLDATAESSADLQQTLATAPGLLSQASTTMVSLRKTLALANPLLTHLEPSAPAVAPTVKDLRGTVTPANRLLARADPLLTDLRPAVTNLSAAAESAQPLLDQLTPSLDELADKIVPYLSEIQPDSKHSFAQMIGPGAAALAAIGAYQDNDGGFVRFPATAGNTTFYLPCQTYINNPAASQVVACESIGQALTQIFGGSLSGGAGFSSTLKALTGSKK